MTFNNLIKIMLGLNYWDIDAYNRLHFIASYEEHKEDVKEQLDMILRSWTDIRDWTHNFNKRFVELKKEWKTTEDIYNILFSN